MSERCAFRSLTRVPSLLSRSRTAGWFPARAWLSWLLMVFNCWTPPPFSSSDRAPKTSSTSGERLVLASGMVPWSASEPVAGWVVGGSDSSMYFSPSRLDCSSEA